MISRTPLAALGIAVLCTLPVIAVAQTPPETAPPAPAVTAPVVPAVKGVLTDAEKEKDIRLLVTLTGGDKMGEMMMDQMIPQMQKMMPQVPAVFWQEFRRKMKMSELTERLLPVYDKYYSKEDVKGLIQFYQSPLGQKVIATNPGISRDSQAIGSAWGEEIAGEVIREFKEKEAAKPAPATKPAKAPPAKTRKKASRS